jgi:hypothetical protein
MPALQIWSPEFKPQSHQKQQQKNPNNKLTAQGKIGKKYVAQYFEAQYF